MQYKITDIIDIVDGATIQSPAGRRLRRPSLAASFRTGTYPASSIRCEIRRAFLRQFSPPFFLALLTAVMAGDNQMILGQPETALGASWWQNHRMTNEHLVALGRITVGYSQVEWAVSAFIWKLLSPDQRVGQTITASLMFSARVSLLRSLFELLEPAYGKKVDVTALDVTLKLATDAVAKRNSVVHALMWLSTTEGGDLQHMNLKPKKAAEWTTLGRVPRIGRHAFVVGVPLGLS